MSFSDYGSTTSDLPDRPLVVKCFFDRSLKRISFTSASNCTFDRLKTKVEQAFSLSACSFNLSYKDDDGEVTGITNDYDLLEAVQYFQAGDDQPIGSNASVSSGRSNIGRRITLRIQVVVDYDGPSLSDTSSLVSMDDYPRHRIQSRPEGSVHLSASSVGGYDAGGELEDDAVTVSSRDVHATTGRVGTSVGSSAHRSYQLPGHAVPSVATSPPSPPPSEPSPGAPTILGAPQVRRSVRFGEDEDIGHSGAPLTSANPMGEGSSSDLSGPFSQSTQLSSTPTAVFEQLRRADHSSKASTSSASYVSGPSAFRHNERGVLWLQEQNARALRNMIGEAAPSSSSDAASLMLEDGDQEAEDIRGGLALQRDPRGRFYYTYTSDSFSQSGYREYEVGGSALDRRISTSSRDLAWLADHHGGPSSSKRPFLDMGQLEKAVSDQLSLKERPLPNIPQDLTLKDLELSDLPPDVLQYVLSTSDGETYRPPATVTNCSSCGISLNSFRYICATCGEKPDHPGDDGSSDVMGSSTVVGSSTRTAVDPKGKGRAADNLTESLFDAQSTHYPPLPPKEISISPASPSPSPSSWTNVPDREHSTFPSLSSIFKSRSKGFKRLQSKSSLPTNTSSDRLSPSVLSLPDTAAQSAGGSISPTSPRSERHPRLHTPASFEEGFELCSDCIYTAGVSHSYEGMMGLDTSSNASSMGSSTWTLATPSSPISSPDESESSLRRSAPERGRMRHAFVEKVWNGSDWIAIEQDDQRTCSTCPNSLTKKRYKCISCSQFNLCRACYGLVHEIHPAHAFLSIPVNEQPQPAPGPIEAPEEPPTENGVADDATLQHPGVTCFNCGLGIYGARFHCAVCESVDICQNCESAGLPGNLTTTTEGGHDSSHIMIKIPYPLESAEVAVASRRARVLWSERDAATINATAKRITPRSRSGSLDSGYENTVVAPGRRGASNPLDHLMRCNGCNRQIVGVRYQCANCNSYPVSYNLCHECERVSFTIHPLPHVFIKFNRRVDRPLQSPHPLLPELYEIPANGLDFADASGDLSALLHDITYCDLCMTQIQGAWYRCAYCSSDMCDLHEQTHNENHCCIVFKSKVDLRALRTITDVENPGKNEPLFAAVYNES